MKLSQILFFVGIVLLLGALMLIMFLEINPIILFSEFLFAKGDAFTMPEKTTLTLIFVGLISIITAGFIPEKKAGLKGKNKANIKDVEKEVLNKDVIKVIDYKFVEERKLNN